jgi:hypothetical protein
MTFGTSCFGGRSASTLADVELRARERTTTLSGRPLDPRSPPPQGLASASLIVGSLIVFLCPALSPVTLLLGPLAWLLGVLDLRRCERRGEPQSQAGAFGLRIGRSASGIVFVLGGIVALFFVIQWVL